MIRPFDRQIVRVLVLLRLWKATIGFMRVLEVTPCRGTDWIYELMLRRQARDNRHHAPCCEANHWHYRRLVFKRCTCGAEESKT